MFNISPSLCLWHLKRAIKRKIGELRKHNQSHLDGEDEMKLLNLIDCHYFRSTVICNNGNEQLHTTALDELSEFMSHRSEQLLLTYLRNNWYDNHTWKIWGRRHPSKVAITRTTMKVEAHWSLLKRLFLLQFNRPRVDLLVHIISSRLLPKISNDYQALYHGSNKPHWWKAFVRTWKQCKQAQPSGRDYYTDSYNYICTCPAWQRAQFFLCKHIVQDMDCPLYKQISLNRSPPFIVIDKTTERDRANIDNEELICSVDQQASESEEAYIPVQPVHHFNFEEETGSLGTVSAEIEDVIEWLPGHIADLKSCSSGLAQLNHFRKKILPALQKYKEDVVLSQRARRGPTTWGNHNTIFLP